MEGFDQQRSELLKAGHGADSKTLLYKNTREGLTELEPDSTRMLAHDEDGKVVVVATDDAEKWSFADDHFEFTPFPHPPEEGMIMILRPDGSCQPLSEFRKMHTHIDMRIVVDGAPEPIEVKLYRLGHCQMGAWILWTLQSFYANMTCSRWYQSWWKWWAKSLQSSGMCPDAHLRKAAPTKRTLEFAGGDDAGMDLRIFQEATWSTHALVHMLVRFSTPSRGSFEQSARVQQIWDRWLGALIVRFFGTTTLDFVIMVDPNCDARPGLPAQGINPIRVRGTNGNLDLSPIALADIASVSPTSVELRRFGDCCTAMPMGVALRAVHRQGRTSLWLYKQLILNVGLCDRGCSPQVLGREQS